MQRCISSGSQSKHLPNLGRRAEYSQYVDRTAPEDI